MFVKLKSIWQSSFKFVNLVAWNTMIKVRDQLENYFLFKIDNTERC